MRTLELLSPARDTNTGIAAIDHGADAVYIGAPQFGARAAAANTLQDIERLTRYAHLFHSKVYITFNTILFDDELEAARQLIHNLYNIGVDALIIQDLGLLEMDLPPIALHASTQIHNYDTERIRFLSRVGFSRIILARECSIKQMQQLHQQLNIELEAFIHGALCVCFSGQCYMSAYLSGRSGNRGCCGQPCRSDYDLYNDKGKCLRHHEHLLSLKDFNASQLIGNMASAGITSFKIEGRLKDIAYVKNITGHYRRLLDDIMEHDNQWEPLSHGKTSLHFTPDPERSFNRGFTTYFLERRQPMASLTTQKSLGKLIGRVMRLNQDSLVVKTTSPLTAGDGMCFFNNKHELEGFFINHIQGDTLFPNRMPVQISPDAILWRNNDYAFEKQLHGTSATRKIPITLTLLATPSGFRLKADDGYSNRACSTIDCEKTVANNVTKVQEQLKQQLRKLGDTAFEAEHISLFPSTTGESSIFFIPTAVLNGLRRDVTQQLTAMRIERYRPTDTYRNEDATPYYQTHVDYRANVVNHLAQQFYEQHGTQVTEEGLEKTNNYTGKTLMTTKYCLRYELRQCLCLKNNQQVQEDYQGDLYLRNNRNVFLLRFDCKQCQMQIVQQDTPPKLRQCDNHRGDQKHENSKQSPSLRSDCNIFTPQHNTPQGKHENQQKRYQCTPRKRPKRYR